MKFEGQYLTFDEYQALGGTLNDNNAFDLLEFEARRQIDTSTLNRLKGKEEIPQEVKICELKLIDSINDYATSTSKTGNIASESIDGYSVSYLTAKDIRSIIESRNEEFNDVIRTYLLGVVVDGQHLMYCGV